MRDWPTAREELVALQHDLALRVPELWSPPPEGWSTAACFICFSRGASGRGRAGEPAWAAAALMHGRRLLATAVAGGFAGAPYEPGLLALREGPLLTEALAALGRRPEVVLVNATGRDHPRRAGLALHLGAALDLPTVGVTHRPLLAGGEWPEDRRGATSDLVLEGEVVGCWLRTRRGARPLALSLGWMTDLEACVRVVMHACRRARTPEPLRRARHAARIARAGANAHPP